MRVPVFLVLVSTCLCLLQGCSAYLATQGTFCADWPRMPGAHTQRASFEHKWGAPVGTVTDDQGYEYLEYHARVRAPKGMQAGQGEGMLAIGTLGLSEFYFLPLHTARLLGAFDYSLETRVQWNDEGTVLAVMEKQQETTWNFPREWTRRVINGPTRNTDEAKAADPPHEQPVKLSQ